MATLIPSPMRSGNTRKLVGGRAAGESAQKMNQVEENARLEARVDRGEVQAVVNAPSESGIDRETTGQGGGLPKYDAETFTHMLERANQRAASAEQELDELKAELRRIHEEAHDKGYAEGLAKGRSDMDGQLQANQADFQALLAAVQQELTQSVLDAEESLVEIAYTAACRVIGGAAIDKNGVIALVRSASQYVVTRQDVVIHVSEHDYRQLKGSEDELLPGNMSSHFQIVADARVKSGGCILEMATGSLDARLEVQLQRLKDAFLTARAKSLTGE